MGQSIVLCTHPSPVKAQQAWMCQPWSLMDVRFRCCEISAADMEPFISCLLAYINTAAFRKSCNKNNDYMEVLRPSRLNRYLSAHFYSFIISTFTCRKVGFIGLDV